MANKRILLIEPGYKNKYPPIGLMKIAQYHGPRGKRDYVKFIKGVDRSVALEHWDRIYITTLFSFEYQKIGETVDFAIEVAHGQTQRIFVGGIAASLMHDVFLKESRWRGIRFIKGLLDQAPSNALDLNADDGDFYADDTDGTPIEDLIPDYDILDQISHMYIYPVRDAYFAYASRGCIRKCHFCGVPKLEGAQRDATPLTKFVHDVDAVYGQQRDMILMDNNVVASTRFKEIIAEIRDLGFTPGAKLKRGNRSVLRRVDFNQGVDARILSKDRMYLRELSSICLSPLRIAFDHLGLKGPYETSIRFSHEFGLNDLSNYMLYNFHDTPTDLFERMYLNVRLNEELGIRIYSFPMRYQPTNLPNRTHIGDKWNRYYLRSVQLILQATHGVVSGEPEFYKAAFGSTASEFDNILSRPHHMIFNRQWFERYEGRGEFDDYQAAMRRLSASEKAELLAFLSSRGPSLFEQSLGELPKGLQGAARFYVPMAREKELKVRSLQQSRKKTDLYADIRLSAEEIVEDAGLDEPDTDELAAAPKRKRSKEAA
jgi:hypothetical protein